MAIQNLAEAVILQSISDLWKKRERSSCLNFFKGDGFGTYAGIAEMKLHERTGLLRLVNGIVDGQKHNPASL